MLLLIPLMEKLIRDPHHDASCIFLQLHPVLEPLCIHNSAAAEYVSATRNTCLFWVCIDPIHVFQRLLPGGQSLSIIFI